MIASDSKNNIDETRNHNVKIARKLIEKWIKSMDHLNVGKFVRAVSAKELFDSFNWISKTEGPAWNTDLQDFIELLDELILSVAEVVQVTKVPSYGKPQRYCFFPRLKQIVPKKRNKRQLSFPF